MIVAAIGAGPTVPAERPRVLFSGMSRYLAEGFTGWSYDVAPDGRFLAITAAQPEIRVVLNFAPELDRIVPR